jgi:hypothetical protein
MATRSLSRKEQEAHKTQMEQDGNITPRKLPNTPSKIKEQSVTIKLTTPEHNSTSTTQASPTTESQNSFSPASSMEKKIDSLQIAMTDLSITMIQLRDDMKSMKEDSKLHENQLETMQATILAKQNSFMEQANKKIDSKIEIVEAKIDTVQRSDDKHKHDIDLLRQQLIAESFKTSVLQTQMDQLTEDLGSNFQIQLDALKREMDEKNDSQDHKIKENMIATNDLEAHGRRWAVRVFGLPSPGGKFESIDDAKNIFIKFAKDKLLLTDILTSDIDCAHRVKNVNADGNQPLLVKFFARDTVDYIMRHKKRLKGSEIAIYGDTTQKNRQMLHELNARVDIENSWCQSGKVWAKLATGKKMKFTVGDDLQKKISKKKRSSVEAPTAPISTIQSEDPRTNQTETDMLVTTDNQESADATAILDSDATSEKSVIK